MFEQTERFTFEREALEWWITKGLALGYCKPFCGGDGWWKCIRYVKV